MLAMYSFTSFNLSTTHFGCLHLQPSTGVGVMARKTVRWYMAVDAVIAVEAYQYLSVFR